MIFGITATSNFDYGCTQGEEDKQVLLRHYPLLEDRLIDGCMKAKRYNTLYQLIEVDTFEEIMDFVEKYNRIVIENSKTTKGKPDMSSKSMIIGESNKRYDSNTVYAN